VVSIERVEGEPIDSPHAWRKAKWTDEDTRLAKRAADLTLEKVNEAIRLYAAGDKNAIRFASEALDGMPKPHLWNRTANGVPELAERVKAMAGALRFIINESPRPRVKCERQGLILMGAPGLGKRR